jgi:hypothetical protein
VTFLAGMLPGDRLSENMVVPKRLSNNIKKESFLLYSDVRKQVIAVSQINHDKSELHGYKGNLLKSHTSDQELICIIQGYASHTSISGNHITSFSKPKRSWLVFDFEGKRLAVIGSLHRKGSLDEQHIWHYPANPDINNTGIVVEAGRRTDKAFGFGYIFSSGTTTRRWLTMYRYYGLKSIIFLSKMKTIYYRKYYGRKRYWLYMIGVCMNPHTKDIYTLINHKNSRIDVTQHFYRDAYLTNKTTTQRYKCDYMFIVVFDSVANRLLSFLSFQDGRTTSYKLMSLDLDCADYSPMGALRNFMTFSYRYDITIVFETRGYLVYKYNGITSPIIVCTINPALRDTLPKMQT